VPVKDGPMTALAVVATEGTWRLEGDWSGVGPANVFLAHLGTRGFATATVRAYAYDLLNFGRFCSEQGLELAQIVPADVFAWIDWQLTPPGGRARWSGSADAVLLPRRSTGGPRRSGRCSSIS
jgi:integrase/recombinase XerC